MDNTILERVVLAFLEYLTYLYHVLPGSDRSRCPGPADPELPGLPRQG